jgi:hypothetical protein
LAKRGGILPASVWRTPPFVGLAALQHNVALRLCRRIMARGLLSLPVERNCPAAICATEEET